MPPMPLSLTAAPWPVLMLGAWIMTVVVMAVLLYGIVKAAINKADARDLSSVLIAVAELAKVVVRPFARSSPPIPLIVPAVEQNFGALEQSGEQGRGTTEVAP